MAINILSPIARLPFGKHKGKVFWTLGLPYLHWLYSSDVTEQTRTSITAAVYMSKNKGCYAVLSKNKKTPYLVTLRNIYSSKAIAIANCDVYKDWEDFVYHIETEASL